MALLLISLLSLLAPQLPAPAANAGAVIAGQVVDAETLAPLAGARVMLMQIPVAPDRAGAFRRIEPVGAMTDVNGQFVFKGLTPGRYNVNVQRVGYVSSGLAQNQQAIDLQPGQSISGMQIALAKGAVIAGRIVDDRGEPIPGVMVSALRRATGPNGASNISMVQSGVQTNDIGEFRLPGLADGNYLVMATSPPEPRFGGAASATNVTLAPTYYPGTSDEQQAQTITVGAGQTVNGIQFTMMSVPAFQVSGVVVTEAGAPASGATISMMPAQRRGMPAMPAMARANADGTFVFTGVIPGTYQITASPQVTSSVVTWSLGPDRRAVQTQDHVTYTAPQPVTITVGKAHVSGVTLVLPAPVAK